MVQKGRLLVINCCVLGVTCNKPTRVPSPTDFTQGFVGQDIVGLAIGTTGKNPGCPDGQSPEPHPSWGELNCDTVILCLR